jgi:hypothetical protein
MLNTKMAYPHQQVALVKPTNLQAYLEFDAYCVEPEGRRKSQGAGHFRRSVSKGHCEWLFYGPCT